MKFITALLLASVLAISGCKSLGLATPVGFDQRLAEAYGVHTAVVEATATALTTGAINSTEASLVEKQALTARQFLDTAKMAETANPAGANNNLQLAITALNALQAYLNSQRVAPKGH